jgi:hypothetical protein
MVEPGALETCHTEQPSEASKLVRTRAQRIPSRSRASAHKKTGYICADQPVHLHFSLATRRRTIHSGLPTLGSVLVPQIPIFLQALVDDLFQLY